MNKRIILEIKACLSQNSFSFDTLILKTKELFDNEGIPGFLSLILSFVDEQACAIWAKMLEKELVG